MCHSKHSEGAPWRNHHMTHDTRHTPSSLQRCTQTSHSLHHRFNGREDISTATLWPRPARTGPAPHDTCGSRSCSSLGTLKMQKAPEDTSTSLSRSCSGHILCSCSSHSSSDYDDWRHSRSTAAQRDRSSEVRAGGLLLGLELTREINGWHRHHPRVSDGCR